MGRGASIENFGPSDLLTSPKFFVRRLQVDIGNTGFFDNREFRYFRELIIPAGESRWTRVTVAGDDGMILRSQKLTVDGGAVRFRAWRDADPQGLTLVAPASPNSGVFRNNGLPSAPAHTQTTVIEEADQDAVTAVGTVAEVIRVRSSGATAQTSTVGQTVPGERGIAPGTYWLQFENISNGQASAVFELIFEERLGQG